MSAELVLYTYFRSSAAFRVRIALNLKGLHAEHRFIHLLKDGGQQHSADYQMVNPQQLIPALAHNGHTITQSLAIIEYLDEVFPAPPLLPGDPLGRARVRAIADAVACDIHPLSNLRVLQYFKRKLGADDEARLAWQRHWIGAGLDALEKMLAFSTDTGAFCHGNAPSMADVFLIPQLFNARRAELDIARWPTLARIESVAIRFPAFESALPQNQPDAE
ncbi:MAG TPA: maleylacetoacetate isomerase [Rhizomicrobium sp.]|nr:maleylacetoacetate isomerase [Rhizomicrobium sp.]